jgi:hypothetical protein
MSNSLLLTSPDAPAAIRRREQAEVERLLEELRRLVDEDDPRAESLRWRIAEAVKAELVP